MQVKEYLHNWPPDISVSQQTALDVLRRACADLPFYLWPQKSVKAHDADPLTARKYQGICGLQALMNEWFRQELSGAGFRTEVPVRVQKHVGADQKVDFALALNLSEFAMVEVEFGNTASLDRDLKKLCDAYHWGRSTMGAIICPVASFSKVITGGDATFEQVVTRLTVEHPRTNASPLLVLGLDHSCTPGVDLSTSRFKDAAQLSGNRKNKVSVIGHVVRQHREGVPLEDIGPPGKAAARLEELQAKFTSRTPSTQEDLFYALAA